MTAAHDPILLDGSLRRQPGALGPGLTIEGDVLSGEDLVIEGRIKGSLNAPDRAVVIADGANFHGRLFAREVLVHGSVQGEITATGVIELAETAKVEADLNTPAIAIAQGAFLAGRVDMRRADAAARVARYRIERGAEPRGGERLAAGSRS